MDCATFVARGESCVRRIARISLETVLFLGESECREEAKNAVANQRAVLYIFTYFRAILSGCVSFLAATPCPHLPQVGVDGAICCLPLRATCIPAPYHPVHADKTDPPTSIAPPVLCLIDQQAFFAAVIRQSCYKPRPALPPHRPHVKQATCHFRSPIGRAALLS